MTLFVDSDGTGQRKSFRRFLHSTMQPLGALAAGESSEKLKVDVSLSFYRLFATDLWPGEGVPVARGQRAGPRPRPWPG